MSIQHYVLCVSFLLSTNWQERFQHGSIFIVHAQFTPKRILHPLLGTVAFEVLTESLSIRYVVACQPVLVWIYCDYAIMEVWLSFQEV